MTDYRHHHHPGLRDHHNDPLSIGQQSSSSMGGIFIAVVFIGLVFLALSLFFSGTTSDRPAAPVIDQTTSQPVAPATGE